MWAHRGPPHRLSLPEQVSSGVEVEGLFPCAAHQVPSLGVQHARQQSPLTHTGPLTLSHSPVQALGFL